MRRSGLLALFLVSFSYATAPSVTKVEPPNWWIRHTWNPVQVMLIGSDLGGATVTAESKGFAVEVRRTSENGHYLFVYLRIAPSVKPGRYRCRVKSSSGSTSFDFSLDAPLDSKGRFQGFSADDVIYLLMPDRFANGDPSNDNLAGLGRPPDRNSTRALHGGDLRGVWLGVW